MALLVVNHLTLIALSDSTVIHSVMLSLLSERLTRTLTMASCCAFNSLPFNKASPWSAATVLVKRLYTMKSEECTVSR